MCSGQLRRVLILRTRYQGEDDLVALAEQRMGRNPGGGGEAVRRRRAAVACERADRPPLADRADIITEHLHAARRRGAEPLLNAAHMCSHFGLDSDASID